MKSRIQDYVCSLTSKADVLPFLGSMMEKLSGRETALNTRTHLMCQEFKKLAEGTSDKILVTCNLGAPGR